jgi:chromosome segregation ATPase
MDRLERSTASSAAITSSLSSTTSAKSALESRITSLEAKLTKSQAREAELQAELDAMVNDDKSRDGQADKERKELAKELRGVKADLKRKEDALTDLQEEMSVAEQGHRERERQLKVKLKAAQEGVKAAEAEVSGSPCSCGCAEGVTGVKGLS